MGAHFQPAPPAAISRVLYAFNRDQLASFIEVAIGLLDVADGDPEAEEDSEDRCEAHDDDPAFDYVDTATDGPGDPVDAEQDDAAEDDDPAGDALDRGELEDWRDLAKPIYAVDQSLGPINEREALKAYRRELLERNR